MTEVLDLTIDLINKKSVTPEDGDCLQLLIDRLGSDFQHEWFNFEDTKNLLIKHGSGAPHLMFLGHVDVVPAGEESSWSSPPFQADIRDGKVFGRGACDMKSGVAAMAVAIKDFVSSQPAHIGTISFLLTSDEEGCNINAIPKVVEEFKKRNFTIDYCIVGEPSSKVKLADTIKVGRRGSISGELIIHGTQGHVAYPQLAENPIHTFAPILTKLTQHKWDLGNELFDPTSLQFSNIESGTGASNVIPGLLRAQFNFRFSTEQTAESLKQGFEKFIETEKLKYELTWRLRGLPFLTRKGKLIECIQSCIQSQFGFNPKLDTSGGTSDARFIAPLGTEVIELGVRGESLHKVDEFVRIEDLEPLVKLYKNIAVELLK